MTPIDKLTPERRCAMADLIDREAERLFNRAQTFQQEADALHCAAHLLFSEADRLAPMRNT